jgi:hypothetical protein
VLEALARDRLFDLHGGIAEREQRALLRGQLALGLLDRFEDLEAEPIFDECE